MASAPRTASLKPLPLVLNLADAVVGLAVALQLGVAHSHPMASFAPPLTSLMEPATLFSSMAGLSLRIAKTALGFKGIRVGIWTLGQRSESRQPRKLLTPGRARRRRRIERSNRMTARRRVVRRSRPCSCQARSRSLSGVLPTARAKSGDVRRLAAEGMTREAIAAQLKIGVASVYRALRAA
jgi:hypothetical protein